MVEIFARPEVTMLVGINATLVPELPRDPAAGLVAAVGILSQTITHLAPSGQTVCFESDGPTIFPDDQDYALNQDVAQLLATNLRVTPKPAGPIRGVDPVRRLHTYLKCDLAAVNGGMLVLVACSDSISWILADHRLRLNLNPHTFMQIIMLQHEND